MFFLLIEKRWRGRETERAIILPVRVLSWHLLFPPSGENIWYSNFSTARYYNNHHNARSEKKRKVLTIIQNCLLFPLSFSLSMVMRNKRREGKETLTLWMQSPLSLSLSLLSHRVYVSFGFMGDGNKSGQKEREQKSGLPTPLINVHFAATAKERESFPCLLISVASFSGFVRYGIQVRTDALRFLRARFR